MNRKLKTMLIFVLGLIVGFVPAILLGINVYRFYRITGMPYAILGPQKFGNVRIMAVDNANKVDQMHQVMDIYGQLGLQNFDKTFINCNFDEDKNLYDVNIYNDIEDLIVSFRVSPTSGAMSYLSYGSLESGLLDWYDLNFDGVFDVQFRRDGKGKDILLNNEWVRAIEETGTKEATVKYGTIEKKYIFNFDEGKWLPEGDSEVNEQ